MSQLPEKIFKKFAVYSVHSVTIPQIATSPEMATIQEVLSKTEKKLEEGLRMHMMAERNQEDISTHLRVLKSRLMELGTRYQDSEDESAISTIKDLNRMFMQVEEKLVEYQDVNDTLLSDLETSEKFFKSSKVVSLTTPEKLAELESKVEEIHDETIRQTIIFRDKIAVIKEAINKKVDELTGTLDNFINTKL
ncbi:unnamed protein product [Phyllotreta striolata]|uniref:Uncharacterized protein n=1 Tax=Phyllotreta striolata TaxID=444603 RepID=A0A9N9U0D7_PHYSR|nr:unnamed protein product [Phyllotreta striolata]